MKCRHEIIIVYTTERISQEYNTVNAEWLGEEVDHLQVLSVDKIICADCGKDVTNQFNIMTLDGWSKNIELGDKRR